MPAAGYCTAEAASRCGPSCSTSWPACARSGRRWSIPGWRWTWCGCWPPPTASSCVIPAIARRGRRRWRQGRAMGRTAEFIPIYDPRPQTQALEDGLLAAAARVIRSGRCVLGEEVAEFEAAVAGYLGVPHAIGVNSGSDALTIALAALGIGPGDEVITTPFTFIATAEAISRLGGRPRFADIDPDTCNLSADAVAAVLGGRTRCILPVHLFGAAADMDALGALAAEAGVPLVEDVAQAFGARWDGRRLGSLGTLGAFSFYPTKNLGGFGDGGLITTHDAALAERCRQLRNHGSRGDGVHVQLGFNSRLDALQAALLRVKLPQVDAWNAERRRLARRYHELLQGLANLRLPPAD